MLPGLKKLMLFCGAAGFALVAEAAGVFKWVDAYGAVHYDDKSLLAERLTRASIARNKVDADAKATVPTEFVKAVAHQCKDLQERNESYASAGELYSRDPVGNQYRLSSNQMALERAGLAQETQRYCRPLAAQYLMVELQAASRAEETVKGAAAAP